MSISEFINDLNTVCKIHFEKSKFYFKPKNNLSIILTGDDPTLAFIGKGDNKREVNVFRFTLDFWIYANILLKPTANIEIQQFSFTCLKGYKDCKDKLPLFRAEWDNYEDSPHPQAHWHFYPKVESEFFTKDIQEFLDSNVPGLSSMLEDEHDKKHLPFERIHFAMNNQWYNNNGHVYIFNNPKEFVNWFDGLLNHLKIELKYLVKKMNYSE